MREFWNCIHSWILKGNSCLCSITLSTLTLYSFLNFGVFHNIVNSETVFWHSGRDSCLSSTISSILKLYSFSHSEGDSSMFPWLREFWNCIHFWILAYLPQHCQFWNCIDSRILREILLCSTTPLILELYSFLHSGKDSLSAFHNIINSETAFFSGFHWI